MPERGRELRAKRQISQALSTSAGLSSLFAKNNFVSLFRKS
jgi:hypothetical protein